MRDAMERRQMFQGIMSAAALACCLSVAILTGTLEQQQGSELLWRSPDLASKIGVPNRGYWGTEMVPQSLKDNIGTNNIKIDDTIRSIKATQEQPNFAAALYKLEKSTASSSLRASQLTQPSDWLDNTTPQLPDPQGFVHRMQRMRLSSRYCRVHPESCKTLAPAFPGFDGMHYATDEFATNPADALEQGSAADLLQAGVDAGDDAAAANPQEMKVAKARTQSLSLLSGNTGGMPWLAPYEGQHGFQNEDENVKWGEAALKARAPVQQLADPMWCGAASCAEHGYARHQHSMAKILGHIVHNEAAIRVGGERNAAEICAKFPAACADADGGGAGHYGYIPGTSIPTVLQQNGQARTTDLAQVYHNKFPSKELGERTFNGDGDSLLPHGQLWGLKGGKNGKTVRYHEYDGFYKGTQPDRAVVDSPQQAASERYTIETKELQDGLTRIRAHNAKLAVAAANVKKFSRQHEGGRGRVVARRRGKGGGGLAKIGGSERDLEEGAALFRVAASPAGTVLPELDQLAGQGEGESRHVVSRALPPMRGLDMSVVSHESPTLALAEEETMEANQQRHLDRLSRMLP
mmetsp:Transcript_46530/g.74907  ORF Transcript_46530/g.74907 Transcript_46530/m.74907 type:complete len:578 (-) Transcript_46530:241-1974(-)